MIRLTHSLRDVACLLWHYASIARTLSHLSELSYFYVLWLSSVDHKWGSYVTAVSRLLLCMIEDFHLIVMHRHAKPDGWLSVLTNYVTDHVLQFSNSWLFITLSWHVLLTLDPELLRHSNLIYSRGIPQNGPISEVSPWHSSRPSGKKPRFIPSTPYYREACPRPCGNTAVSAVLSQSTSPCNSLLRRALICDVANFHVINKLRGSCRVNRKWCVPVRFFSSWFFMLYDCVLCGFCRLC